ncbi:hypothetical protein ACFWXK_01140 [Streptomyces sp. NPDC059070]|uniref:hypothetical protein n=1 Tax=unclassified Streptomyces TaxID=2593676 RepID=UPI0034E235AD
MSLGDEHDSRRPDTRRPEDAYSTVGGTRQTRTRLPEGEGDAYGGARRPVRASRSLITVVGVVVVLVAAIAFANRGDGGDGGGSSDDPKASGARPTAASGTRPVEGKTGGIASGFPQTEQGAQSAAANYAVALGSEGMYTPSRRREIVAAVYAPDVAAARQSALDQAYAAPEFLARIGLKPDGAAPAGMAFISRFTPVGAKVEKFDSASATVSVWCSSLFGLAGEGSKNPVSEGWYTQTFQLRWAGDWKVVDYTQKDGPAPVGRDQAAATAKDMAEAVEQYGGFTYAR